MTVSGRNSEPGAPLASLPEGQGSFDARQAGILELHFIAGMTFEEVPAALGISVRMAKRGSNMACAWMKGELSKRQS